jgi:hypothetical protein
VKNKCVGRCAHWKRYSENVMNILKYTIDTMEYIINTFKYIGVF